MRETLIKKVGLSFSALVLKYFRDVASHAVELTQATPSDGEGDGENAVKFTGVFDESVATDASAARSISFGHLPAGGAKKDLSQRVFYQVRYSFDRSDVDERLTQITLRLSFLNARLFLFGGDWIAAESEEVSTNVHRFKLLSEEGESRIGLAFECNANDKTSRFEKLKEGIPEADFEPPEGFVAFDEDNLVFRLDLNVTWSIPKDKGFLDDIEECIFGDELGIPGFQAPATEQDITIRLFHESAPEQEVDAVVHASRRFAMELSNDVAGGLSWVAKLPKEKPDDSAEKKRLRRERLTQLVSFGLGENFEGLLLDRLALSWLDGNLSPSEKLSGSINRAAIAFGDSGREFYFSAEASVGKDIAIPLIDKAAAPLTIRARYEASQLRYVTLEGTFEAELDDPWGWLEQRTFAISVIRGEGTKASAEPNWGLELSVSGGQR